MISQISLKLSNLGFLIQKVDDNKRKILKNKRNGI